MVPCVTLRWIRDVLQSSASERIDLTAPTYQAFDDDRETANSMLLDYNKSVGLLGKLALSKDPAIHHK